MLSLLILYIISLLSFVSSNYEGSESSLSSSTECESHNTNSLESSCLCFDEPENDFGYEICKDPGTVWNKDWLEINKKC